MSEAPKGTDVDVSLDIVSLTGLSIVASFPEPSTPRFILQLWRKYFSTYKSGQERDYIHRSVLAHMDIRCGPGPKMVVIDHPYRKIPLCIDSTCIAKCSLGPGPNILLLFGPGPEAMPSVVSPARPSLPLEGFLVLRKRLKEKRL